jgi:acetyl esterase
MAELDPEAAAAVEALLAAGVPEWHELSVAAARRVEDEVFAAEHSVDLPTRDLAFPGPDGPVPVRAYRPEDATGALVFFHGGGWTLGTLDSVDPVCRALAARSDRLVVSVDYRLAPENPFPAAVDDAVAALEWTARNAGRLGGDADWLGVAGTSAGGALAAATALYAREFGGPSLDHQLLAYPMTDRNLETDSHRADSCPLLSTADVRWFWGNYLRSPVDAYNPFAAPLRTPDLSGLPPATVLTAGVDPLCDEGRAYATRLEEAGVPVAAHHYPGLPHGFLSLTDDVQRAARAMDAAAERLRQT